MNNRLFLCVAGLLALLSVSALAADSSVLANDKIRVIISGSGQLGLVENLLAGKTYPFNAAGFLLETDRGYHSPNAQSVTRLNTPDPFCAHNFSV